jgi:hypothetical protein
MKTAKAIGAWAILAVLAGPAAAAEVQAQDPASIVSAMQKAGYQVELTTDSVGDPKITSATPDNTLFQVLFYNCTNNVDCRTIQLNAAYTDASVTLEGINEWNRTQRFGQAYLDKDGDPVLQMDIDLDDGGISQLLFEDNLQFWTSVIARFEEHIGG